MNEVLTLARLRELLSYVPSSGEFFWICRDMRGKNARALPAGGLHSKGYWRIKVGPRYYFAHRLAWAFTHGEWPSGLIDHINGVKTDNRIENLRDVSPAMNVQNQRKAHKSNKTGLLGAHLGKGGISSCITVNRKNVRLGSFRTAEEAHEAYLDAKRRLHDGCVI